MDLDALLAAKRQELEQEKRALGLRPAAARTRAQGAAVRVEPLTSVPERPSAALHTDNGSPEKSAKVCDDQPPVYRPGEPLPPELLKYIQPHMMLKTGEFSPNNPLLRGAAADGHELFPGLGAYEERRKRLRRLRQQEYKDYLDKVLAVQAEKRVKAKEEQKPPRPAPPAEERLYERVVQPSHTQEPPERASNRRVRYMETQTSRQMVDSGTQCGSDLARPSSVAVQTDDAEVTKLSANPANPLTQAERELSPRTVVEPPTFAAKVAPDERPIKPSLWTNEDSIARRKSCDQVNADREESKRSNRDKLMSDLKHTYLPSLLDADIIRQRNVKAEQEATERRLFYRQELKSQIVEQQRIREERKQREKLLERAEMRRLEDQLGMLQAAQEREAERNNRLSVTINDSAADYGRKRNLLQKEIDVERSKAFRSYSQPLQTKSTHSQFKTSNMDHLSRRTASKLPFYYENSSELDDTKFKRFENCVDNVLRISPAKEKPSSVHVSDNSLFSSNYDVDNYLRKNLNPTKDERIFTYPDRLYKRPYEPSFLRQNINVLIDRTDENQSNGRNPSAEDRIGTDDLPIPVLRHSPKITPHEEIPADESVGNGRSEAMKTVEGKWQVPIVQKNILRSSPSLDGRNKNILTQLGSIRRQLQLEQLKLDNMLGPSDLK